MYVDMAELGSWEISETENEHASFNHYISILFIISLYILLKSMTNAWQTHDKRIVISNFKMHQKQMEKHGSPKHPRIRIKLPKQDAIFF